MAYETDAVADEMHVWDWNEIKDEVDKNEGVTTVTMEKLRRAHGTKKLGTNVREAISATLTEMGLGHVPEELPRYQDDLVRIYDKAGPVGRLINLVLKPGDHNDFRLREYGRTERGTTLATLPVLKAKCPD